MSGLWAKFPRQEGAVSQRYGGEYTGDHVNIALAAPAILEAPGGYYGVETGLVPQDDDEIYPDGEC